MGKQNENVQGENSEQEVKTVEELKVELQALLALDARTKEQKQRINTICMAVSVLKTEAKAARKIEQSVLKPVEKKVEKHEETDLERQVRELNEDISKADQEEEGK